MEIAQILGGPWSPGHQPGFLSHGAACSPASSTTNSPVQMPSTAHFLHDGLQTPRTRKSSMIGPQPSWTALSVPHFVPTMLGWPQHCTLFRVAWARCCSSRSLVVLSVRWWVWNKIIFMFGKWNGSQIALQTHCSLSCFTLSPKLCGLFRVPTIAAGSFYGLMFYLDLLPSRWSSNSTLSKKSRTIHSLRFQNNMLEPL